VVQLVAFTTSEILSWTTAQLETLLLSVFTILCYIVDYLWNDKCINFNIVATFLLQSHIFLLNCDVCCSFPLPAMLGKYVAVKLW